MSLLTGSFNAEGESSSTTNSTVTGQPKTGVYEVKFSNAFSSVPAVVVTPQTDNMRPDYVLACSLNNVTQSGFTVIFQNLSSPAVRLNSGFSFFAAPCD